MATYSVTNVLLGGMHHRETDILACIPRKACTRLPPALDLLVEVFRVVFMPFCEPYRRGLFTFFPLPVPRRLASGCGRLRAQTRSALGSGNRKTCQCLATSVSCDTWIWADWMFRRKRSVSLKGTLSRCA